MIEDIECALKKIAERDTRALFAISVVADKKAEGGMRGWVDFSFPEEMKECHHSQWDEFHDALHKCFHLLGKIFRETI